MTPKNDNKGSNSWHAITGFYNVKNAIGGFRETETMRMVRNLERGRVEKVRKQQNAFTRKD